MLALAGEKLLNRVPATRVRHIRIDELAIAFWTRPERTRCYGSLRGNYLGHDAACGEREGCNFRYSRMISSH